MLGLKAGNPRVVVHEQPARVGQHQARTLRRDGATSDRHPMRRGIMLHPGAGSEVIFTDTPRWLTELRLADPARQAAICDLEAVRGEQLLGTLALPRACS